MQYAHMYMVPMVAEHLSLDKWAAAWQNQQNDTVRSISS